MIDLHGHYLPWVDHGASTLDEALQMLRMAEADGVRFAVTTPTIDPARVVAPRTELERKFAAFATLAQRRGIGLRLRLGAELVNGPAAVAALDRREVPFLGEWEGRRVVLLRWAEDFIPIGAISVAQEMLARGMLPMLARPERNPGVARAPGALELFLRDGCLVQVDAGSVLGWHGPQVRDTAFRLIEAGMVTVLASGAVDAGTRPPMLRAARDIVAQRFGDDIAIRLTELNPSLVVARDLVPPRGVHAPSLGPGAGPAGPVPRHDGRRRDAARARPRDPERGAPRGFRSSPSRAQARARGARPRPAAGRTGP